MKFFKIFYLLLIPFIGCSQMKENQISFDRIQAFDPSRCELLDSITHGALNVEFPMYYRDTYFPPLIWTIETWIPFEVYFQPENEDKLFLIFQGKCRGLSTSFPMTKKGVYYVRYFDPEMPSLAKYIPDEKRNWIVKTYMASCSIHQ